VGRIGFLFLIGILASRADAAGNSVSRQIRLLFPRAMFDPTAELRDEKYPLNRAQLPGTPEFQRR
jgi:hypothetical protein